MKSKLVAKLSVLAVASVMIAPSTLVSLPAVANSGAPKNIPAAKANAGPTSQVIGSGTQYSYRYNWGRRNGTWDLSLNWGVITNNSRVYVAISECDAAGNNFLGSANYTVLNVVPRNGAVTTRVNIGWSSPIGLCMNWLVYNP